MQVQLNARIKSWKKRTDKWGTFVIETDTRKYDKNEGKVVETTECFDVFCGGSAFQDALKWVQGVEKKLTIDIHSDTAEYNNEERHFVNISVWKIEEVNKASFKDIAKKNEPNDKPEEEDLPF